VKGKHWPGFNLCGVRSGATFALHREFYSVIIISDQRTALRGTCVGGQVFQARLPTSRTAWFIYREVPANGKTATRPDKLALIPNNNYKVALGDGEVSAGVGGLELILCHRLVLSLACRGFSLYQRPKTKCRINLLGAVSEVRNTGSVGSD